MALATHLTIPVNYYVERLNNIGAEGTEYYLDNGGRKYIRVVQSGSGTFRSVHSFIEADTGMVLKPAGWKAPAKGARADASTVEAVDNIFESNSVSAIVHGGFLYL